MSRMTSGGRAIRGAAWMALFCAVSACVSAQDRETATAAEASTESSAAIPIERGLVVGASGVPEVRWLERFELGPEFCLMRVVPDGNGGTLETRIPVSGIRAARTTDWKTRKPIRLFDVQENTHCDKEVAINDGDTMDIDDRAGGGYRVRITNAQGAVRMDRVFGLASRHAESHLYSRAERCVVGKSGCFELDVHDAYLYLLDVRNAKDQAAKVVMLDFFRSDRSPSPNPKCEDERPDSSMRLRTQSMGTCPVPDWLLSKLGNAGWKSGVVILQTGTGGGYEPP